MSRLADLDGVFSKCVGKCGSICADQRLGSSVVVVVWVVDFVVDVLLTVVVVVVTVVDTVDVAVDVTVVVSSYSSTNKTYPGAQE